eukprot:CAMPEP_0178435690 /NCGR_PEP_ID=MMETSP0689_2-20121128/34060_1 /TAXON_ID=160604 /ORGANISM="Amphidinium massartii, Strain CS-259" /LENGTH=787 /DNA_ID=CAMNT_0020057775 /DNA_START=135 /DNA_END=2498 /DNA_ORIENTATION=+
MALPVHVQPAAPLKSTGKYCSSQKGIPTPACTVAASVDSSNIHHLSRGQLVSILASSLLAVGSVRRHRSQRKGRTTRRVMASDEDEVEAGEVQRGTFPPKATPLLDSLNNEGPAKVRNMTVEQLEQLADEVRWQTLDAVSVTGGHLGSALGVVELTVALHHVFDTPRDDLVWDVAHQVYPHKILTGRRDRIYTLRQGGGLSGFAKRAESPYDAFGAGHSTTSISAAVGFQTARDVQGQPGHSVAIIGDGAITGGMAWEAMNHAGGLKSKVIVILNDNGQVSLPTFYNTVNKPVGALSETLATNKRGLRLQGDIARIESSEAFQRGRQMAKEATKAILPAPAAAAAAKFDEYVRDFIKTAPFSGSGSGAKGELFESLGFYYVGPIDGHDMNTLVAVLENLKKDHADGQIEKPILLHVKTEKGRGYRPAETASDKLHAATPNFNLAKKASSTPSKPKPPALTTVFGNALVKEGERDDKIVAITAAMPGGTGVSIFEKRFGPERTYDVGIAEQHAVTFAAGLAAGGLKPFCCIYSTFLQRGYDQVVHDCALQKLPVRFVLDRAGLVGADGPTHCGAFDLSYLACIPDILICCPSDEAELVHMTHTIAQIDDTCTAMRYPRGAAYGDMDLPEEPEFLEPGKGRIIRKGDTLAILSIGSRLREAQCAAERLESWGVSTTVADARWAKPIDEELVADLAKNHKALITVEENAIGGFAAQVQNCLLERGLLDGADGNNLILRSMVIPDRWIAADDPKKQYDDAELNANNIMSKAVAALTKAGVKVEAPVKTEGR